MITSGCDGARDLKRRRGITRVEHHVAGVTQLRLHQRPEVIVVVDDQDAARRPGAPSRRRWPPPARSTAASSARGRRQREREARALVELAVDEDAAAVLFDQRLGDGEAEAGAALAPRRRAVDLLELAEQAIEIFGRDALALIGDGDA